MALLKHLALGAAVLLLAGCVADATNVAEVYKPVDGVIDMSVTIPAGESFAKVQFQADGTVVGEDSDGTDGYTAEVDTSTLPANTLVKIAAVGVHTDGTTVVLKQNFVLVGDSGVKSDSDASGTGDTSATGTSSSTSTAKLRF
jgi:hypothetical protein